MGGRIGVEEARAWADTVRPMIDEAKQAGATTLQEIADALNARGVSALRGGAWSSMQVWRVLRQGPDDAGRARR